MIKNVEGEHEEQQDSTVNPQPILVEELAVSIPDTAEKQDRRMKDIQVVTSGRCHLGKKCLFLKGVYQRTIAMCAKNLSNPNCGHLKEIKHFQILMVMPNLR